MENCSHFSFWATVLFFSLALIANVHFALESAFISLHLMYHVYFLLLCQCILKSFFCIFFGTEVEFLFVIFIKGYHKLNT